MGSDTLSSPLCYKLSSDRLSTEACEGPRHAMARSASCPARLRGSTAPASRPVSYADVGDLSNSNDCGFLDTKSVNRIAFLRTILLNAVLRWMPVCDFSFFEGGIYSMVWWNPTMPDGQMIVGSPRPWYWHTTLMRAEIDQTASHMAPVLLRLTSILNSAMQGMIAAQRNVESGAVHSWLDLPPWRSSWCFGCPTSLAWVCEPVMLFAESLLLNAFPSARLRDRREFHISWN